MSPVTASPRKHEDLPIRVRAGVSVPSSGSEDIESLTEAELWEAWNAGQPDADDVDDVESMTEEDFQAAWDAAFEAPSA